MQIQLLTVKQAKLCWHASLPDYLSQIQSQNIFCLHRLTRNCLRTVWGKKQLNHSLLPKGERRNGCFSKITTVVWLYSSFISVSLFPFFPCDCPKCNSTLSHTNVGLTLQNQLAKRNLSGASPVPFLVPRGVVIGHRPEMTLEALIAW